MLNKTTIKKYFSNASLNVSENITFNNSQNYYVYIIANNNTKKIKLFINQKKSTDCKVTINCLATNNGIVDIVLVNNGNQNCKISQEINGLIINDGKIFSFPILAIKSNTVVAQHSINVGGVDKEQIFYLTSKGISPQESTNLIVEKLFEKIESNEYKTFIK
ncbi:MAG: SufD family Fe-S cluster assembly protein [Mycoplasmataceae bacterium]|jgi:Fe-S cluster assembly scaffold protein SufB|nr:SufD family Fe-S cluster assembly protein [Mycoplasmataceae bacterium]